MTPRLGLALFLLALRSAFGQATEENRAWNQPVPPFKIIGNIYYVGAREVCSYLITTPAGHIVLDGGFVETAPQIEGNITQLGFRLADVKILISSHAHLDHAGGLAELKEKTGAKFMAMKEDADLIARGGKDDFAFGDRLLFPPITADRELRDGDKVDLGGVTLIARLTPGHTKGCTSWTTQVEENGRKYDVVFVGSTSVPGYTLLGNPKYPNMKDDYEKTFALMKKLPCDVFLASHGSFFSLVEKSKLLAQQPSQNPFIDPNGYRKFIEQTDRAFHEQLQREESK
ncbi:MAG: subclass B3 metallo-beta-lactamase [Verrucomicrobiota bacterium]|nr:subclass B3 metallo-beta-lactamase [Verrucomicrobiota bacterium]